MKLFKNGKKIGGIIDAEVADMVEEYCSKNGVNKSFVYNEGSKMYIEKKKKEEALLIGGSSNE